MEMAEKDETHSYRGDIRELYNPTADAGQVCFILHMRPPPTIRGLETSGLDCLVVVMRIIYAQFIIGPSGNWQEELFLQMMDFNPILWYAWQMFDRESPPGYDAQAKENVLERIRRVQDPSIGTDFTFKSLCLSNLLIDSFWARPDLNLYRKRMIENDGDPQWYSQEWVPRESGTESMLLLDLSKDPEQTIEGLISTLTREEELPGARIRYLLNRPCIIRILLTPDTGARPKPSFNTLRSFHLPIGDFFTDDTGETIYKSNIRRERYGLIAVVRMRSKPEEHDLVRTYYPHGPNVVPEYTPAQFMTSDWSFDDSTMHQYMLFYVWCDHADFIEGCPEVQPCPEVDDTHARERDASLAGYQRPASD